MKKAIIIGGGPAGLTAAYELLKRTDIVPVVLERSDLVGGLSKTVNYKGNRIDIGGHRFFSKSSRIMEWWLNVLPIEDNDESHPFKLAEQNSIRPNTDNKDQVMLLRNRISRIYFLKRFFNYPISLTVDTIMKLGFLRMVRIFFSYSKARLFPRKNEQSLEDFFINRFGFELYNTFFKDYTEKVWGIPCNKISAEWGAQRIKGLSISKAIVHAAKSMVGKKEQNLEQKKTETSLIEYFLYPKYGPGQMWETVANTVTKGGGEVLMHREVKQINVNGNKVVSVTVINKETNQEEVYEGDYIFSSMPIKDLVNNMKGGDIPADMRAIANGLLYRDFITVGLLMKKMKIKRDPNQAAGSANTVKDNWIYIQEREVKIGRLQIFNNWSPYMVNDPDHVWLGLEYFCNEGDELWTMPEDKMRRFAIDEMVQIGLIDKEDVLDSVVLHIDKAYPAYFGTYDRFEELRNYLDTYENMYLIGRNGMHKYNNSDHSMLTAITAVDNIINGRKDRKNIWSINMEKEYHETTSEK